MSAELPTEGGFRYQLMCSRGPPGTDFLNFETMVERMSPNFAKVIEKSSKGFRDAPPPRREVPESSFEVLLLEKKERGLRPHLPRERRLRRRALGTSPFYQKELTRGHRHLPPWWRGVPETSFEDFSTTFAKLGEIFSTMVSKLRKSVPNGPREHIN